MSLKNQNLIFLTGRIGNELKLQLTNSGVSVLPISLAYNESFKNPTGGWSSKTHWFQCVAWDKIAEAMKTQLSKGDEITISGKLKTSSFMKEEIKLTLVEITIDDFKLEIKSKK